MSSSSSSDDTEAFGSQREVKTMVSNPYASGGGAMKKSKT
jgi:hypothetical protein